jgi:uncharacterized membrane-anchored protein YhcB (DUF1043 family)
MIFIIGAIVGLIFGIVTGIILAKMSENRYNNPGYTPLADAELRRLQERMQDYYNNPVVEYMKRTDHRR